MRIPERLIAGLFVIAAVGLADSGSWQLSVLHILVGAPALQNPHAT